MISSLLNLQQTSHVTHDFSLVSIILIESCIFSNIAYSGNGGVFYITGSLINQIISQMNDHLYCRSTSDGGVYYIDAKYDGNFTKNLFHKDYSGSYGMVLYVTNGASSNVLFESNTISYCPSNFEGPNHVIQFYYGKMVFKCLNCSYCAVSRHTMFDTYQMNFIHLYNHVNHNRMGCIYRPGGTGDGAINYTNHINNTVQGTDWGFIHDYTGKAIVFTKCLFVGSDHSSFAGYNHLAYYVDSFIFQCKFGPNTVPNTPTPISDLSFKCLLTYQNQLSHKSSSFHYVQSFALAFIIIE